MVTADHRLVQTAVIGGSTSNAAIVLPQDAGELRLLRRLHPTYTYWCGTLLGGCGNRLSDRLYEDKVCHFAHAPNTSCHRRANGANSADHLFAQRELADWARERGIGARTALRNLGEGPGDAVDFRVRDGGQRVRFQFRRLTHPEWLVADEELEGDSTALDWVFGPGAADPETVEEMYDVRGHLLRFRFETHGTARRMRIRAETPRRGTDWVPLDACAMTPRGLRIPGTEPGGRGLLGGPSRGNAHMAAPPRGAVPGTPPRSDADTARALRDALVAVARLRTRTTWESLCRTTGLDAAHVTPERRLRLLAGAAREGAHDDGPLLSALLRAPDGTPPAYVGEVAGHLGRGTPASPAILKRWCQREAERAYAAHGVPPRAVPAPLRLTEDGRIAQPGQAPGGPHTIVHVQSMPARPAPLKEDLMLRRSLREARESGALGRLRSLLAGADAAARRLPEVERELLVLEVGKARGRLAAGTSRKGGKKKRKSAVTAAAKEAKGAKGTKSAKGAGSSKTPGASKVVVTRVPKGGKTSKAGKATTQGPTTTSVRTVRDPRDAPVAGRSRKGKGVLRGARPIS
jgi:hypothetical protein